MWLSKNYLRINSARFLTVSIFLQAQQEAPLALENILWLPIVCTRFPLTPHILILSIGRFLFLDLSNLVKKIFLLFLRKSWSGKSWSGQGLRLEMGIQWHNSMFLGYLIKARITFWIKAYYDVNEYCVVDFHRCIRSVKNDLGIQPKLIDYM